MTTEKARALVALAVQVRQCARRLATLRAIRPEHRTNGKKQWTIEEHIAEIRGQERRQREALTKIAGLIATAEATARLFEP